MKQYTSRFLKHSFLAALLTAGLTEFTAVSAMLIDSIIVSKCLGAAEIAVVGIGAPFHFLVSALGTGLSIGLQTVCTREMGRGNTDRINQYMNETLAVAFLLAAVITALAFLATSPMAILFGAKGNAAGLLDETVVYLHGLGFKVIPYVALAVLTPVVVLDNGSKTVLAASVCGALSDVVFDGVAVLLGGGIFGIGLATSGSVLLSLLILLTHFLKKDRLLHFRVVKIRWKDILEIVKLSLPKAIHMGTCFIRPIVLNALIVAAGGSLAMSVLSIRSGIADFVEVSAVGVAGAVSILAGVAYGERNGEDLESVSRIARRYILIIAAAIVLLLCALFHPIAVFYLGADSPAIPLLSFAIVTTAVGNFFTMLIYTKIAFLQAVEKVKAAQMIEVGAYLVSLLSTAALLSIPFGAYGVFAAFAVSQIVVLLVLWIVARRQSKKTGRTAGGDYLRMDDSFYPKPYDVISYPVRTMEHCALASEQINLFCKGHGMSKKQALYAGICVEEILTNIMKHVPTSKTDADAAEIRVTISGDRLILRMRDNTAAFNLSALARLLQDTTDPAANLGLKLICKTAEDIRYYSTLGINTAIITI